jgi:hypothetical protein
LTQVRFKTTEEIEDAIGKKVIINQLPILIARYHVRDNVVFYLAGFDALPIDNVARGITKATGGIPFHLRQVVIEGIKTDAVVIYFERPPGIVSAEVVVQDLPTEEVDKVKAWRCRMAALSSNATACQRRFLLDGQLLVITQARQTLILPLSLGTLRIYRSASELESKRDPSP